MDFPPADLGGSLREADIYVREEKERGDLRDRLEEKHKGIGEESNCNQGCPGMILATLGILTHT